MKVYKVSEDELRDFLRCQIVLSMLEAGGVDNWTWYGESLRDGIDKVAEELDIKPAEDEDFITEYDLVDYYMKDYEEV